MSIKKTVAIIPARGGSKSIPKKNIRMFAGKPLIAWTIECALSAKGVDRVIVSTDSEEIKDISITYGAEVPFIRPDAISASDTPIEPVIGHVYKWLVQKESYRADALILLFPTNPLREKQHVEDAVDLFYTSGADSVITVNESPAHYTPYWTLVRSNEGRVSYFDGGDIRTGYVRRQDFPARCFAKNDVVFVIRPDNLFGELPSLYGEWVELLEIERIYDGDINTNEDWELTLIAFNYLSKYRKNH